MDPAAEIEKEYGKFNFTDPIITFGYNKIEFRQKFNIFGKALLILLILFPLAFILFYDLPSPFIFIAAFVLFNINVLYEFHRRWDIITIDFMRNEIIIVSDFFFINIIRKFFSARTIIPFDKIAYFNIDDGKRLFYFTEKNSLSMRRTTLFVKPAYKQDVALVNFRFERDARRLGELLQNYVVGRAVQLTSPGNV